MKKFNLIFTAVSFCTALIVPHAGHSVVQITDTTQTARQKIQAIQTDDDIPVGTIMPWPSAEPIPYPAWLPCDGSAIPDYGPYKDRYAFLRRIIGSTTPNYNNSWRDHKSGAFLRGSNDPRYGMRFEDSTKTHIHTQPPHEHEAQRIQVQNPKFTGQSLGQEYTSRKRGSAAGLNGPGLIRDLYKPGTIPSWAGVDVAGAVQASPNRWTASMAWKHASAKKGSWGADGFSELGNSQDAYTPYFLEKYLTDSTVRGQLYGTASFTPRAETYCDGYTPIECDEKGENCIGGECIKRTENHNPSVTYSGTAHFKSYAELYAEKGSDQVALFFAGNTRGTASETRTSTAWESYDPFRRASTPNNSRLPSPHPNIEEGDIGMGGAWVLASGNGGFMSDSVAFGQVIDKTVVGNDGRTPGQNDGFGLQENGGGWSHTGKDNRTKPGGNESRDGNESNPAYYNVVYIIKAMP